MSGAAFAQSNVTIYGVMDAGQAWVKSSDSANNSNVDQKTVGRLDSNTSYIGFKGTEALGNGLTALFQYESNISSDTAAAMSGGRDTYVGLTGGFGTAVAGNLTHPLRAMGSKVEILPGSGAGFGSAGSITGEFGGYKTGADDRAANAVAYVSPSFSGLTATVAYVNGEATESSSQNGGNGYNSRAWQIAGQYENGPIYAGIGYHKAYAVNIAAGTGNTALAVIPAIADFDARIWRLAGTYTLPTETKLMALYDNTLLDGPAAGDTMKRTAWSVGVAQPFGAHTVGLQYAKAGDIAVTGPDDNDGAKMWTLAYSYSLSKRTMIHARYSKLNNDNDGASTFYSNPVGQPNGTGTAVTGGDIDYTGYMVGLRHTF